MSHNKLSVALEVKETGEDGTFKGYASVFGVKDTKADIVDRGAFAASLMRWQAKGAMPPMLWQHDMRQPIGRYDVMREDDSGLYVEGKLSLGVSKGREAYELLKDGVIKGLSIGYMTVKAAWDDAQKVRRLQEVDLMEASLVTMPANALANVVHVKAAEHIASEREFEDFLKKHGYSQTQAKGIAAKGYKSISHREGDDNSDGAQREAAEIAALGESLTRLINVIRN